MSEDKKLSQREIDIGCRGHGRSAACGLRRMPMNSLRRETDCRQAIEGYFGCSIFVGRTNCRAPLLQAIGREAQVGILL